MSEIIDCEMHIGDEVFVHGYIDEIRNDTIIIRNVGGYFGTSRDEVFYYEEDERGYGTMNEADRKTENSSEKPNNCEDLQDWKDQMWAEAIVTEPTVSKMEQVDKPYIDIETGILHWCGWKYKRIYEDEPQIEVKRGCIHCSVKDNCQEAYTEKSQYCGAYEQTDCAWK